MLARFWQSVVRWWRGGEDLVSATQVDIGEIAIKPSHAPVELPSEPKPSRRNPAKVRAAMRRLERDFNVEPGLDKDVYKL